MKNYVLLCWRSGRIEILEERQYNNFPQALEGSVKICIGPESSFDDLIPFILNEHYVTMRDFGRGDMHLAIKDVREDMDANNALDNLIDWSDQIRMEFQDENLLEEIIEAVKWERG